MFWTNRAGSPENLLKKGEEHYGKGEFLTAIDVFRAFLSAAKQLFDESLQVTIQLEGEKQGVLHAECLTDLGNYAGRWGSSRRWRGCGRRV